MGVGNGRRRAGPRPAVALPAHYPSDLDTLGHPGLIYADTLLFVVSALIALAALRTARVD